MGSRKVKPLKFDSAGGSVVRFFGPLLDLDMHFAQGSSAPRHRFACPTPDTCGQALLKCNGHDLGVNLARCALVWDVKWKDWRFLLADASVFHGILNTIRRGGIAMDGGSIESGDTCDIILQRSGHMIESEAVTETLGEQRGNSKQPKPENLMCQMAKDSVWHKMTPDEVVSKYPKKIFKTDLPTIPEGQRRGQ